MANPSSDDNQIPPVQQEVLRNVSVEGNLTLGDIHQNVVYAPADNSQKPSFLPIDERLMEEFVEEVREKYSARIEAECGKMSLLNQQVFIGDLYTDVYILEDIPSQRFIDVCDRVRDFDPTADDFDRFYLGKTCYDRVPGLEVVTDGCKLMCLGAPGSGKTTYLYYIATQCSVGELQPDRVPIFLRLLELSDYIQDSPNLSLIDYISQKFREEGIQKSYAVENILFYGKALILLDGLDEVPKANSRQIIYQIQNFCRSYHRNSIILTCRTNASEYSFTNLGFTEISIADFNQRQIESFASKWFTADAKDNSEVGNEKAQVFIQQLNSKENKRIRDLAVTPVLLNLTCLVFRDRRSFPVNRAKLYQKGIDILLKEWDSSRGIKRDRLYRDFSVQNRKRLLAHIAATLFVQNRYFFDKDEVAQTIIKYLCESLDLSPVSVEGADEEILKAIEVQHGLLIERSLDLYSFSHLTFQEYLTAQFFRSFSCEEDMYAFSKNIEEYRWREVFLLLFELEPSAISLLRAMKLQIDKSVASEPEILSFLNWIEEKSLSAEVCFKRAAIRAFYIALQCTQKREIKISSIINPTFANVTDVHLYLDRALGLKSLLQQLKEMKDDADLLGVNIKSLESVNIESLEALNTQYLSETSDQKFCTDDQNFCSWWQTHGQDWRDQLDLLEYEYYDMKPHWNFDERQKKLIKKYYDSTKMLVECMNRASFPTLELKAQMQSSLFLACH